MKAFTLSLLLSAAVMAPVLAQTPNPNQPVPTAKDRAAYTLQQQFSAMKYRSSTEIKYNQEHKVVKQASLDAFFKSVQDTLRAREQSIKNAGKETAVALAKTQQELEDQKAQVLALQQDNTRKEQQIQQTQHNIDSLSVLGLDMNKQVYVYLSLAIILGLGILAAVFAFMFKNSNAVTQEKIQAYETIDQELKEHKQAAREREVKLKREMQSEANKVEDLKQQLADLQKKSAV